VHVVNDVEVLPAYVIASESIPIVPAAANPVVLTTLIVVAEFEREPLRVVTRVFDVIPLQDPAPQPLPVE
jgi:hypothetical protein